MTKLKVLIAGARFRICALAEGNVCNVEGELEELRRRNRVAYLKLRALLESVAETGIRHHGQHVLRPLGNSCIEFKENRGTGRIFGFIDPTQRAIIVCTSVWVKQPRKQQNEQIQRLYRIRQAYVQEYRARPLPVEE